MTWSADITGIEGLGAFLSRAAFAPGVGGGAGRLAAWGRDQFSSPALVITDDGTTWAPSTAPPLPSGLTDMCYAAAIGLYIAIGQSDGFTTSTDTAAWSAAADPFSASISAISTNTLGDAAVVVDVIANAYWVTTDGSSWASNPSPIDSLALMVWIDDLGLWFALGGGGTPGAVNIQSSPDLATWTPVPSPWDDNGGFAQLLCYNAATSQLVGFGFDVGLGAWRFARSADGGATWTEDTGSPFDTNANVQWLIGDDNNAILAVGLTDDGLHTAATSPGDGTWAVQTTPLDSDTCEGFRALAVPALGRNWIFGTDGIDGVGIVAVSEPSAIPPTPTGSAFPGGKLWRFVVCDLDGTVLSWLDNLAEQRSVVYTLNAPAVATGQVPSDNPQVNLIVGAGSLEGDPIVSYSDRILFGFRREGSTGSIHDPWKIRFAGLLMQLEDAATTDIARSQYTAYDPWQYMLSRPCRDNDGSLPGPNGLVFDGGSTTADQVAVNLIANTDVYDGHTYIDALDGHIETIPFTGQIVIQQGTSVGDALTQLCNTGLLDIWMEPIYDPTVLPLFLAKLNIYAQQGAQRNDSPMSWDSPPKSLVGISRLLDGAQMANQIQFYNGQGGPAVTLQSDADSTVKYGEYWAQQFFPAQVAAEAVEDIAAMQLELRKLGRRTLTINPAPERAPDPFTGYFLGDLIPVYATKRLRQPLS